jgi:hypothetical protein
MSHATLLVICPKGIKSEQEVAEYTTSVMERYNENREVAPYVTKYYKDREEYFQKGIAKLKESVEGPNASKWSIDTYAEFSVQDADYWFKNFEGDGYEFDADGNITSTYNPDSMWDWYVFGGRWNNMLVTKAGVACNICKYGEFSIGNYRKALMQSYRDYMDSDRHISDKDKLTEEQIVRKYKRSPFSTYAVLTEDGKWESHATLGWWGCSLDRKEKKSDWDKLYYRRFLKNLDPEQYIALVDYHI